MDSRDAAQCRKQLYGFPKLGINSFSGAGLSLSSLRRPTRHITQVPDMRVSAIFLWLFAVSVTASLPTLIASEQGASLLSLDDHPRLSQIYSERFTGKEGEKIKGFQLQKVFVIVTPGLQSTSLHYDHQLSNTVVQQARNCNFEEYSSNHRSPKVRSYKEIVSLKRKYDPYKAKSLHKVFNAYSESKICKERNLTPKGLSQMVHLGEYLLKSYFNKLQCLDSVQLVEGFASTRGDETLFQSLSALLHGLLTEKQFVHYSPTKSSANYCQACKDKTEQKCQCTLQQEIHTFVEQSFNKEHPLLKDSRSDFIPSPEVLSVFGEDSTAKNAISFLGAAMPQRSDSFVLKDGRLSHESVTDLFQRSDAINEHLSSHTLFQSYSKSRSLPFLTDITDWLTKDLFEQSENKLVDDLRVRSVDDLFMLCLLNSLNIPVKSHISPASRLVVETFVHIVPNLRSTTANSKDDTLSTTSSKELKMSNLKSNSFEEVNGGYKSNDKNVIFMKNQDTESDKNYFDVKHSSTTHISNFKAATFFRVLYNGQVVTSSVPGCVNDEMISLGLCSLENFVSLLRTEKSGQQDELKQEL